MKAKLHVPKRPPLPAELSCPIALLPALNPLNLLNLEPQTAQVPEELRFLRSKLHLVDLAGSERVKDTGATGEGPARGA